MCKPTQTAFPDPRIKPRTSELTVLAIAILCLKENNASNFRWLLIKKMKFISNLFEFKESFLEVVIHFFHLQELGQQKARQEEMSGRKGQNG